MMITGCYIQDRRQEIEAGDLFPGPVFLHPLKSRKIKNSDIYRQKV